MTEIEVKADTLVIRIKGADQLWTLRSELQILSTCHRGGASRGRGRHRLGGPAQVRPDRSQ